MSVREQIYIRTGLSPAEVADTAAVLMGGQAEQRSEHSWLLIDTDRLVSGATGEFGGPVLKHASEAAFRPDGEYEAADFYNIEIRLWQAYGPRVDVASGRDIEAAAASVVFAALAHSIHAPMIHVRHDDSLVCAALPGRGSRAFPEGTTIYDWDNDKWGGFVVTQTRVHGAEGSQ